MAKNRTLNEIRQSKEYQRALQGGDFIKPTDKPAKSTAEVMLDCLLYTSPSPRDRQKSRMPSSA